MTVWPIKPLSEACTIKPPKAQVSKLLANDDLVSFAPMEDLGIGSKHLRPQQTRCLGDVKGSYTYFADGDVILAKITPCFENGKLGIARDLVNGVGFGSSEYIVLRPSEELTAEYLYYYLSRPVFLEEGERSMTGAVGHKRVSKEFIERYPIPVPAIREQRRIVAILDEAFEAVGIAKANAERNLQNARKLYEQAHQAAFASLGGLAAPRRLGDLADFRNGINFTKQSKGRSVPIIGVKDFQNHFWAPLDYLERVTLDGDLSAADTVSEGDILAVRSNGNPELIGRCILVGEQTEPVTHSGFTIRIRLHSTAAMPAYVCQFMKSSAVRRALVDGGNGLNIKSLNQGMLSDIVVPLPPIAQQHEVAAKIDAVALETTRLSDVVTRKRAALDELKRSLLHRAFAGQLTTKTTDQQLAEVA